MGPKPKSKKGDKRPVSEVDPNENVTELMKQFFEIQLADIEKKINRIKEREQELQTGTAEIEAKIEEYKKEKGVIISEHEQALALKQEEKVNKRNEMNRLSRNILLGIENQKARIKELEERYEAMVRDLTHQIQALEEDVKILEDFKQNRDVYTSFLDEQNRQIEQIEIEHKRALFAIESKCHIARARVKKELESKLLNMSIEFQQVSQKKIGTSCHRVTQENKAIANELRLMGTEILEYRTKEEESLFNVGLIKGQAHIRRKEKDKAIARTIIQNVVIDNLLKDKIKLLRKLQEYSPVEIENRILIKKLRTTNAEIEKKDAKIDEVKKQIEIKIDETAVMNEAFAHLKRYQRRLHVLIRNALKIAEEGMAVRLIPLGGTEEEKFMNSDAKIRLFKKRRDSVYQKKGRILQYLFDVLAKAQMSDEDKRLLRGSSETIDVDQINFNTIYRPFEKEVETPEAQLTSMPEAEKASLSLGSDVSLPRSVSVVIMEGEDRSDSEMGEFEEDYEEEDGEGATKDEESEQQLEKHFELPQDEADKGSEKSLKS